ncbi:ABC transporter permease [Gallaecimonas xiamenensis]|uniref:ABC transporter n=1 Tax=Gallaecimonas xiamenensis 3-C-1 TaxID=745411 RepID=K2IGF0_9GAMM|nr:ABC transporter permease [Gallaecimonas xiamenensis]EKE69141.1 ABC transporter [Gallaecimonas xiamenensis 3-C-1]
MKWRNVYSLGVKELWSVLKDPVLMVLILYTFTLALYAISRGASTEVKNASVAVEDMDRSALSERISEAFLPPYFKPAMRLDGSQDINRLMEQGKVTFVLQIPPRFAADLQAGRQVDLALQVDASAMSQAGVGAGYIEQIVQQTVSRYFALAQPVPVNLVPRVYFNPNLDTSWFGAVMQVVNNVTLLSIILTGAAVIREREHGTLEHLLVMPLSASEIMLAKIWANGLVILVAVVLALYGMVKGVLGVPISDGAVPLFVLGALIYLGSVTSLGILLATLARTMPQFGLLAMPTFVVMQLLSGGTTPLDSMPQTLQYLMQLVPSTHFVSLAQAVLYRGAGLSIIWPQLLAVAATGSVFFWLAFRRFRRMVSS